MCFNEEDLLYTLNQLATVLEYRKTVFKEQGCPNIDTYNETTGNDLPRLIFACDEVAEVLDKTGADSERKKLLSQIESKLSTIARQGRAFGIHLILATQRPDATIIPGQIRNNMDFRVCGRADSVLSQIILDNTSAAEQIPKTRVAASSRQTVRCFKHTVLTKTPYSIMEGTTFIYDTTAYTRFAEW